MNKAEKNYLGIELGSTRIKSVLVNGAGEVRAIGSHTWENRYENGLWTYSEEDIDAGFRAAVADLAANNGGVPAVSALGISGMMHGYIALDASGKMIAPFLTWRNTNAQTAAEVLTSLFGVNVPMRWSIAQLYRAILQDEAHVKNIAHITTLSGYIHYKLTGKFVLGIGDASGMFPIDSAAKDYDGALMDKFDSLIAAKGYPWKIRDILPRVLVAGEDAGALTEAGSAYMGGFFPAGLKTVPPEGDAGTGMVATNCVKVSTANISVGTSIFAMVVMDKPLQNLHIEIDPVTTPDGKPVAMVHANNCTSDINAWAEMFVGFAAEMGLSLSLADVLTMMFKASEKAPLRPGLINYNFISGEPIAGTEKGVPLFMHGPDAALDFASFAKAQVYSCIASMAIGMDILYAEGVRISEVFGHGGFFKTPVVGQKAMSAVIGAPVSVMETAGEGGAWGMALLASFADSALTLDEYLDVIFANQKQQKLSASEEEREAFLAYLAEYKKWLPLEKQAEKII